MIEYMMRAVRAVPRRTRSRPSARSSRAEARPKIMMSTPPAISAPLKNAAEPFLNVPSWLKCRCHHT